MLAIALSLVALGVAVWGAIRVPHRSSPPDGPQVAPYDDSEVRSQIAVLAEAIDSLHADYAEFQRDVTIAVDDGIRDMKRRENRVRATVRRAREELEEGGIRSPGLEAEVADLFGEHGEGGQGEGMPAVQQHVADPQQRNIFAAFPGSWEGWGS